MSTILDEALRYREELGLGVFPVDPVTKKPRFAKRRDAVVRRSFSGLRRDTGQMSDAA